MSLVGELRHKIRLPICVAIVIGNVSANIINSCVYFSSTTIYIFANTSAGAYVQPPPTLHTLDTRAFDTIREFIGVSHE